MKKTLLLVTVVTGLMAAAAQAQQGTPPAPQTGPGSHDMGPMGMGPMGMGPMPMMPDFTTLDANADGQITMEEIQAQSAARFAAADTSADGALSAEEVTAMIRARMEQRIADEAAQMIENMDNNGDGMLQADELRPQDGDMLERMFARIDTDDDGQISQAEFDAAKDRMAQRMQNGPAEGKGHGWFGWAHGGRRGHGN